jgi:Dyp-type peroxidase family
MAEQLELDDIQGLLARGYRTLPHAAFLLLRIEDVPAARATLRRWAQLVTPASRRPDAAAVHAALTGTGMAALSPGGVLPAGLAEAFSDGMTSPYRSRLLGDSGPDDPAGWAWGGPGTDRVDAALLVYARDTGTLADTIAALPAAGLRHVGRLDTVELADREHFGFRDGLSQPTLDGLAGATAGEPTVRAGEFVLGYRNEYGLLAERPLLDPRLDPGRVLPPDANGSGAADLGRNGSYLVFRQLRQDVPAFRDHVAAATRKPDGSPDPGAAELLAARLVGRWPGGAPLVLSPDRDDPELADANDFGYHHADPRGLRCPIGAHVRRTNPRDALEPGPGTESSRAVNRRHRLLRRGRGYDTGSEVGLHFLCLNADPTRQYEFVQHSWVDDPSFNGLVDAVDPLVGPRGPEGTTFVEAADPVRRRHRGLPRFVQVRGGAYFFLPGIRALRYLAGDPSGRE